MCLFKVKRRFSMTDAIIQQLKGHLGSFACRREAYLVLGAVLHDVAKPRVVHGVHTGSAPIDNPARDGQPRHVGAIFLLVSQTLEVRLVPRVDANVDLCVGRSTCLVMVRDDRIDVGYRR